MAGAGAVATMTNSVRRANLARLAALILAEGDGISRATLAARTGLTGATASRLVRDLIAAGIVVEEQPSGDGSMGRPSSPLHPARRTIVGIGLEINVDHVAGCAVDLSGEVIASFRVGFDGRKLSESVILRMVRSHALGMIDELRAMPVQEICGVSLAAPGMVDSRTGRIVYASNLGWSDIVPAATLSDLLGDSARYRTENDANLQALAATAVLFARESAPSFLYLFGEIGVGSAIVRNGVVDQGSGGWAGELGHTVVDPRGLECHCGSRGCLETFLGRRFLLAAAGLDIGSSSDDLLRLAQAGDPGAVNALTAAGRALGAALSNALNLLDSRCIVLGPGLAPFLPWLEPPARSELDRGLLGRRSDTVRVIAMPAITMASSVGGALSCLQERLSPSNITP